MTSQTITGSVQHSLHLTDPLMLSILHLLYSIDYEVKIDANVALSLLADSLPKHLVHPVNWWASISWRVVQRHDIV